MTGSSERAVLSVLSDLYAAWADNDAKAFAETFAADATSILPGSYRKGKEAIHDNMAAAYDGPFKGSRVVDEVQQVRFLGADAAVVTSRSAVLMAGETEAPDDRWVMATWVLSRQEGRWLISAYHNCAA